MKNVATFCNTPDMLFVMRICKAKFTFVKECLCLLGKDVCSRYWGRQVKLYSVSLYTAA